MNSNRFQIDIVARKAKASGIPEETLNSLATLFSVNKNRLREYISGFNKSPLICKEDEVENVLELLTSIGISAEAQISIESRSELDCELDIESLAEVDDTLLTLDAKDDLADSIDADNDELNLEVLSSDNDTAVLDDSLLSTEDDLLEDEMLFKPTLQIDEEIQLVGFAEDENLSSSENSEPIAEISEETEQLANNGLSFDADEQEEDKNGRPPPQNDPNTENLKSETKKQGISGAHPFPKISIELDNEDEFKATNEANLLETKLESEQPTKNTSSPIPVSPILKNEIKGAVASPVTPQQSDTTQSVTKKNITVHDDDNSQQLIKPKKNVFVYISVFIGVLLLGGAFFNLKKDETDNDNIVSKSQIDSILKENSSSEEQRITPKVAPIELYSGKINFNEINIDLKVRIQDQKINSLTFEATKTKIDKISENEFLTKKFEPKFISLRSAVQSGLSPLEKINGTARISYQIENKNKKTTSPLSFQFDPKKKELVIRSVGESTSENYNHLEIGNSDNKAKLNTDIFVKVPLQVIVERDEGKHSISELIDSEVKKTIKPDKVAKKNKQKPKT